MFIIFIIMFIIILILNSAISCKEAVNSAYETTLKQGINHEQRLFWATFATEDRKIGMEAFANKKAPEFKNK